MCIGPSYAVPTLLNRQGLTNDVISSAESVDIGIAPVYSMPTLFIRHDLTIYLIVFFFFNDTAPTEIYTLSLHDALPISVIVGPGIPHRDRGVEVLPVPRRPGCLV